jgi:hypothetical protein
MDRSFAVFTGVSTDATGGPIFNYRLVDTGIGCAGDYAACAAPDGVYFVHADGVYRTTGGEPQLVSQALQPFFDERTHPFFSQVGPLTSPRIHAGDDRLYVWQRGSTEMFMMDLRSREWTYWELGVAAYTLLPLDTPREFLFTNSTGQLYKFSPDYANDDGTAIASHYQSGFQTLAEGKRTRLRGVRLEGSGTLSHALAVDFATAGATQSVTLGTAPATDEGWDRRAVLGRHVGFKTSAASGAWALTRWTGEIASVGGER